MEKISRLYAKTPIVKRSNSSLRIQRKKSSQPQKSPGARILLLQRTIGNQAVQRMIKSGTLQTKLKISQPVDKYEQEADRVSEQVMRMPEPTAASGGSPHIQRACPECEVEERQQSIEEEGELQAKAALGSISENNPNLESRIQSLKGGGQPLSEKDLAFFEPRFGLDFSQVRIHNDDKSSQIVEGFGAIAFTHGQHIFMDNHQYSPGKINRDVVLGHELSHTVQQRSNSSKIMFLTPNKFRRNLGTTPQQRTVISILFANKTFRDLWNYLNACTATPTQDLGPLRLKVTPGLTIRGVERFGGYNLITKTLEINPTKAEHVSNPTELIDTIIHEMIHAVDDLQSQCIASGSPSAPLKGGATIFPPTRASVAGTTSEAKLIRDLGPGASNPCGDFLDINAVAQQMIVQVLNENIQVSGIGRPTLTFVNVILRRNPTAINEYEKCRKSACGLSTAGQRTALARCSANIIGKFIPPILFTTLLPTKIFFDFDSSILQLSSLEKLDLVALFLIAHPDNSVHLIGHTDPVGSKKYNLGLGKTRAEAVEQELLRKKVDPRQILSVTSLGEEDILSKGHATHWKDRRVEIIPLSQQRGP